MCRNIAAPELAGEPLDIGALSSGMRESSPFVRIDRVL
jgi:hypothetical protein